MKSYFVKTPLLFKYLFLNWKWSFSKKEKVIYLTFDDGPTPVVTDWVLTELEKHKAKATFFCIGKNIFTHPEILDKIIDHGHSIGNHTNNHFNGWKADLHQYLDNVIEANKLIPNSQPKLFRPPYGKLTLLQSTSLRKFGYKIIMWDILSADFDNKISSQVCLENVIKNVENGSIIVFHDSIKAQEKLQYVLPKVLEYYSELGFKFEKIIG
ncbi:polysaccharide deacetylase family protein [Lutibacter sp.]|uniref:polysaccharide deacetylase family protein n=1 Tax=Lutibacter sp. TaxID=1925666 RepID=UPI002732B409|nr:polysaccharide deacetylase family protein [Lutibacter sp.]MDP3312783.1 polysaccharide deacetylase family protein [Lutibacter sp.]